MEHVNTIELSADWQLAGDSIDGQWWLPRDSTRWWGRGWSRTLGYSVTRVSFNCGK